MKSWEKWEKKWNLDKIRCIWSSQEEECKTDRVRVYTSRLSGESMLDVGCGGGMQFPSYAKEHPNGKYTGVDVTPKMIQVAKEFHAGVDFQVTDGADLPFKYGDYETVLLRHLIEHQPAQNGEVINNNALMVCKKNTIIVFFIPPKAKGLPEDKTEGGFYATLYSKAWIDANWGNVCKISYHDYPDSDEMICVLTPREDMTSFWYSHRAGKVAEETPGEVLAAEALKKEAKPMKAEQQVVGEDFKIKATEISESIPEKVEPSFEEVVEEVESVPIDEVMEEHDKMFQPSAPMQHYSVTEPELSAAQSYMYDEPIGELSDEGPESDVYGAEGGCDVCECDECECDDNYEDQNGSYEDKFDKVLIIHNHNGGVVNINY